MTKLRVAVSQSRTVPFDAAKATKIVLEQMRKIAAMGAELAVFPEAFIGGYPKGLDFGASIGSRTPAGREDFRRYQAGAIRVPGAETDEICAACGELGLYVVVGVIERDGGTIYCTSIYCGPEGLLGKHRKVMPTASERLVWGFGDGSTLTAVDMPFGRVGGAICWENYMPMLRMAMYAKGVEIWCAPTADDRETWEATMRHVACEGRCFVLSACQVMERGDCPQEYDCRIDTTDNRPLMRGRSMIVDPLGKVLAGPLLDEEGILTADIDLDDIPRAKMDFDPVGHYARPDLFRLIVDERQKQAVQVVNEILEVRGGSDEHRVCG